jgi:cob(I)alamin adenosyltransferase
MANRLSKIVTRTGDDGNTGLADGSRRNKNDVRIHCLGEVDELNANLGLLINFIETDEIRKTLLQIQHDLFDLGAELAQPGKQLLNENYLQFLEQQVERLNEELPALQEFILPGGSTLISTVHLVRTVCRRVERNFEALHQQEEINTNSLCYINRLSDFLFILGRFMARQTGQPEVYWQSQYSRQTPAL